MTAEDAVINPESVCFPSSWKYLEVQDTRREPQGMVEGSNRVSFACGRVLLISDSVVSM